MKIQKKDIVLQLKALKPFISTSDKLPRGILWRGNELLASNVNVGGIAKVHVEAETPFILPERAVDMLERLPNEEIEINVTDSVLDIESGRIKNTYNLLNVTDFPEVDATFSDKDEQFLSLNANDLMDALQKVLPFVPTTSVREVQTGVLFEADGENLNLVGCDGRRIAWLKIPCEQKFKFVVPKATVDKFLKMPVNDTVSINYTKCKAVFQTEKYLLFTLLLDGEYLNYRSAFTERKNSVGVDRYAFSECLSRVLLSSDTKARQPVVFEFENRQLNISQKSALSEYEEPVELQNVVNEKITLGFDVKLISDAVKMFDDTSLIIKFDGKLSPITITNGEAEVLTLGVQM